MNEAGIQPNSQNALSRLLHINYSMLVVSDKLCSVLKGTNVGSGAQTVDDTCGRSLVC